MRGGGQAISAAPVLRDCILQANVAYSRRPPEADRLAAVTGSPLKIPNAHTDLSKFWDQGTQFMLLNQIYRGKVPRAGALLTAAFILTLAGITIAFRFFNDDAGVISVFFVVLGMLPTVDVLIERNKRVMVNVAEFDFSQKKIRADAKLAVQVLLLFVAIFVAYSLVALYIPLARLKTAFLPQLGPWLNVTGPHYELEALVGILFNNFSVCAGVLFLSVLYRTGGALLVLTWNASVWGTVFAYFARNQSGSGLDAFVGYVTTMACVFPHILLEAVGYIIMALGGVIVVRCLAHLPDPNANIRRMATNAAMLCASAVLVITIAGVVEVTLAPTLLDLVSKAR